MNPTKSTQLDVILVVFLYLEGPQRKKQKEQIYLLPQKIVVCFELLGEPSLTVDSLVHGDEKVARLKAITQTDNHTNRHGCSKWQEQQLHNVLVVEHVLKKLFEDTFVRNDTK